MEHHEILWRILRINRQRIRIMREMLTPLGYVGTMHLIIMHLGRHPGANQDQVTGFFSLDKGSVARDSARLESMGHIRREQDPENRRQYKMYLTEEGKKMRDRIMAFYDGYNRQLTEGLSPEEEASLFSLLTKLDENSSKIK